jgi:hypothetical protein
MLSCSRRRLPFEPWDCRIDASPSRRLRRPYRRRRLGDLAIIKRPAAYKRQMRPRLSLTEYMRTALRTKPAMHNVAAVGNAAEVSQLTGTGDRAAWEAGIDRSTAGSQILTQPAPAHACDNWCAADPIAHGLAQAPAGNIHDEPRSQYRCMWAQICVPCGADWQRAWCSRRCSFTGAAPPLNTDEAALGHPQRSIRKLASKCPVHDPRGACRALFATSKKTPDGIVNLASVDRSLCTVMRRVREYDALPPLRCGPRGPEQLFLGARSHAIYRYFHCSTARRVRRTNATSAGRAGSSRYVRACAGTGSPRGSRTGTRICRHAGVRCSASAATGTGGSRQYPRGAGVRASTASARGER